MNLKKILKNKVEAKHVYYIVMTILYGYLIVKCGYQYLFGSGLYGCKLELLLMLLFALIVYFISFFKFDFFNKQNNKKDNKTLSHVDKKNCILESSFLALLFTTFLYLLIAYDTINVDFHHMIPNQAILSVIGLAILLFLVFFAINYLIIFRFSKKKLVNVK